MFNGIEGARGWLAWIVVAAHVIVHTPLVYRPELAALVPLAIWAVKVFIVISGFVIAHLLLGARESYSIYICRRALRIYPAYLVALALGIAATPLLPDLLASFPIEPPHPIHQGMAQSRAIEDPTLQLLLHLSLFQGVAPATQHGFLPPAWSLSLEWQFYLLAPFLVVAARARPVLITAIVGLLWLVYLQGAFGRFANPSLIVGAAWYFLAGIFSRLHLERLPSFGRYPWAGLLLVAMLALLSSELVPVIAWLALLAYIRSDSGWRLLDGRLARYFGTRSYAVYILHQPILMFCAWFAWVSLDLSTTPAILVTASMAILLILLAAELVYRWVERPAIRFGKRLGREPVPGAQGW